MSGRERGNGQGSVTTLKDSKGKKKYQVRVTVGSKFDAEKERVIYTSKSLGVFKTKAEAESVLAEYNSSPYDLTTKITTVGELYDYWSVKYFEKIAPSAIRSVESAWAYCEKIRNLKLKKLGSSHIRDVMDNGTREVIRGSKKEVRHTSTNTKLRIKSMFNLMLDEAVGLKLVTSNVARSFDVKDMRKEADYQKKKKSSFSNEELELLWKNLDYRFVDMILIGIYSGFRPSELCNIEVKNVDLENNTIVEGMKTEAGRDRVVPIHPLIKPLVEKRYNKAIELNSNWLFNDIYSPTSKHVTYDKFRHRFTEIMRYLGIQNKTGHCVRVTFITMAYTAGLPEYAIKRIVGHSLKANVTDSVYNFVSNEQLYQFMCQIPQYMSKEAQKNIQTSKELLSVLEGLITNMKIEK